MKKLFLLSARGVPGEFRYLAPWENRLDVVFSIVVRAETEQRAREIAQEGGGDERCNDVPAPWLMPEYTSCEEISFDGDECLICASGNGF